MWYEMYKFEGSVESSCAGRAVGEDMDEPHANPPGDAT